MSKANNQGRSKRGPEDYFVQLYKTLLKEPAWKALPFGARCLYIELKSFYNGNNNGELFLSVRMAADNLGCTRKSIESWFKQLIEKGFIRRAQNGSLGIDGKGRATSWILTEIGFRGQRPTKEYKTWNEVINEPEKTKPRPPQGDKVSYSGGQLEGKCPTQGDRCPTQGDRKDPFWPDPCPTQGDTYNIPEGIADNLDGQSIKTNGLIAGSETLHGHEPENSDSDKLNQINLAYLMSTPYLNGNAPSQEVVPLCSGVTTHNPNKQGGGMAEKDISEIKKRTAQYLYETGYGSQQVLGEQIGIAPQKISKFIHTPLSTLPDPVMSKLMECLSVNGSRA